MIISYILHFPQGSRVFFNNSNFWVFMTFWPLFIFPNSQLLTVLLSCKSHHRASVECSMGRTYYFHSPYIGWSWCRQWWSCKLFKIYNSYIFLNFPYISRDSVHWLGAKPSVNYWNNVLYILCCSSSKCQLSKLLCKILFTLFLLCNDSDDSNHSNDSVLKRLSKLFTVKFSLPLESLPIYLKSTFLKSF